MNRIAERVNRPFDKKMTATLRQLRLHPKYWGLALSHILFIHHMLPISAIDGLPLGILAFIARNQISAGHAPSVAAHMSIPSRTSARSLSPRPSSACILGLGMRKRPGGAMIQCPSAPLSLQTSPLMRGTLRGNGAPGQGDVISVSNSLSSSSSSSPSSSGSSPSLSSPASSSIQLVWNNHPRAAQPLCTPSPPGTPEKSPTPKPKQPAPAPALPQPIAIPPGLRHLPYADAEDLIQQMDAYHSTIQDRSVEEHRQLLFYPSPTPAHTPTPEPPACHSCSRSVVPEVPPRLVPAPSPPQLESYQHVTRFGRINQPPSTNCYAVLLE
ncbi:hypothetical protein FRB94_002790 [Tulasnella sp. JGI-2019a]|nr:hypothetical protein FRB94_002790 [Tulasnella sp. JGI-2019a]